MIFSIWEGKIITKYQQYQAKTPNDHHNHGKDTCLGSPNVHYLDMGFPGQKGWETLVYCLQAYTCSRTRENVWLDILCRQGVFNI